MKNPKPMSWMDWRRAVERGLRMAALNKRLTLDLASLRKARKKQLEAKRGGS